MELVERLNASLTKAEEEIEELQEKLQAQESELARAQNRNSIFKLTQEENLDLPIPRLEIRYELVAINAAVAKYGLVYRHLLGDIMHVPLGHTKVSGVSDMKALALPFRDGSHMCMEMVSMGLRGFVVGDGKYSEIILDESALQHYKSRLKD